MNIWETDTFLARWLNNELTHEEKEIFEKSDDFKKFQAIREGLSHYESPAYNENEALQKAMERIQLQEKTSLFSLKSWTRFAAAASILLVVCFGIYFAMFNDKIVSITANAKQEVNLPDGSSMVLSSGASAKYNESDWKEERKINLKGEAFFNVQKGNSFQVMLNNGTVSVLGTSFNIQPTNNSLQVSCYTGKVKVEGYGQTQIIKAGESVQLFLDSISLNTVNRNAPIWINQVASYKNIPLQFVINEFSAFYNIEFIGAYDHDLYYTGQFPIDDIEVALKQLFGPYQIRYQLNHKTKKVLIFTH